MPPRLVIESHDSGVWDLAWKQMFVFQPVNINLFPVWFACYFPGPCPVWVSAKAVNCDYTTGLMCQFEISQIQRSLSKYSSVAFNPSQRTTNPNCEPDCSSIIGNDLVIWIFLFVRIQLGK